MAKVLYDTKYLQLKSTLSKTGSEWVYAHRPNVTGVVVILPQTDDEILFIIEERPPLLAEGKGRFSVALPAGLVGDERGDETIDDAIKAELLEETGLIAKEIEIKAKDVSSSSGCVSETCTLAFAYIESKVPVQNPVDDGGVIVDRIWVKKAEVYKWLAQKEGDGYVLTAQTLAALFYMYDKEFE